MQSYHASPFSRTLLVGKLSDTPIWDIIIIGGGASGLGVAVDAASRGYATLLLEKNDFAKGTSSRSTKLIHGGVRYLEQGNLPLVYGALKERGFLFKNAPHLVKKQSFILPCYSQWQNLKYLLGLKFYDALSRSLSLGSSHFLNIKELQQHLPTINTKGLKGGVKYYDGQFDDARLAINLAQTCVDKGGIALNYFSVDGLIKQNKKVCGVTARDGETGKVYELKAKVVVNATGVFAASILEMDEDSKAPLLKVSQGIHLVVDKSFLPGNSALLIPETSDGRVLFAVPWKDHVLLGTTDTPLPQPALEPVALKEEIDFILKTASIYLTKAPVENDVLSVFAGLRPLVIQKGVKSTKELSRDHKLLISNSNLITLTGGKWTTYRKMAEDTVNMAIKTGNLIHTACNTKQTKIHGYTAVESGSRLSIYGSDEAAILSLIKEKPSLGNLLVEGYPDTEAEVIWAVRNEMARTVEDVLARRLRMLFLSASSAVKAMPRVAALMREELQYDDRWEEDQKAKFIELVQNYKIGATALNKGI